MTRATRATVLVAPAVRWPSSRSSPRWRVRRRRLRRSRVLALGCGALIAGITCVNLERAARLGGGRARRARCPKARGAWGAAFAAHLSPRRARARRTQRDLRAHHRALPPAPPRRCPTASSCSTRSNRIEWANPRAQCAARPRPRAGHRRSRSSTSCASRSSCATSRRATTASRRVVPSQRDAGHDARDAARAVRGRREAADVAATSPSSKRSRACAATSSPTCRTSSRRR